MSKKKKIGIGVCILLLIWWWNCLPSPLFQTSYSTLVFSKQGELLDAHIAKDGQWRFPSADSIPDKFKTCITYFEDEYFYKHPGVNPFSIGKAIYSNLKAGRKKRGGSTLTMQTIRLSRKNPPRTVWEKILELFRATRLEVTYSKEEILKMWATHAPYGSNVVGLEAAAWRYYGRSPFLLSWAETATLAVLPNAPALIYPGKNQQRLIEKRNRLLKKLKDKGVINNEVYELSLAEEIPKEAFQLPHLAPHFIAHLIQSKGEGKRYYSTLSKGLQQKVVNLGTQHQKHLTGNEIHNAAIIVIDIQKMEVLSYLGNTSKDKIHARSVDLIQAPRSSGSILKPLLYYKMIEKGMITPSLLLEDIPTTYGNYRPKNFSRAFEGLVPAHLALSKSLNVPAVRSLKNYTTEQFLQDLRNFGVTSMPYSANHYGLSLILGGAEVTLFEMGTIYAQMGQSLLNDSISSLKMLQDQKVNYTVGTNKKATYETLKALLKVNRPNEEEGWEMFESLQHISWKTGTSFGHRDAWAIGLNDHYLVGVWVGNADGEGRPAITGVKTAAPIMFDVFRRMGKQSWFKKPTFFGKKQVLCSKSGYPINPNCKDTIHYVFPSEDHQIGICPFHQKIYLNKEKTHRVKSNCYPIQSMKEEVFFVPSTIASAYYRRKHSDFTSLPPLDKSCMHQVDKNQIEIIYPIPYSHLKIPIGLSGELGEIVFVAAHQDANSTIHWHLDDEFLESTQQKHNISVQPEKGKHVLHVIDEWGNEQELVFFID